MTKQQISSTDLRKYRTELPNLYDEEAYGLDPYEFRLLAHYVRVGTCWESTRTTAKKCKMSAPQVVAKRRTLKDKGFINLGEHPKTGTILIEVVDRWAENFALFTSGTERSPHERGVQDIAQKKEPIKKEQNKKLTIPEEGIVAEKPQPEYVDVGKEFQALEKKKPKPKHRQLMGALAKVTGLPISMQASRLGKSAKKLAKGNFTPEQVIRAFGTDSPWYEKDWRGKKRQKPTPELVVEQIKNLLEVPLDNRQKYAGGKYSEHISH